MSRFLATTLILVACSATSWSSTARAGDVYVLTNNAFGNEVVHYDRRSDGSLVMRGIVSTGGNGSGPAPTSTLFGAPVPFTADSLGSQSSLARVPGTNILVGVNSGSDSIFCMNRRSSGLVLRNVVPSGGTFPVSIAVYGRTVYVLNAGVLGNVSTFLIKGSCRLVPLSKSSDSLASLSQPFDLAFMRPPPVEVLTSGSQIGVSPDGRKLVISYKGGLPSLGGCLDCLQPETKRRRSNKPRDAHRHSTGTCWQWRRRAKRIQLGGQRGSARQSYERFDRCGLHD